MILEAAGALFAERGYGDVGIDEIGAAVGVTGPAIYSHFRSKNELLSAVIERAVDAIDDALEDAVTSCATPREALERFLEATIRIATTQAYVVSVFVFERQHLPEDQLRRIERKRRAMLRTEIELLRQLRPDLDRDRLEFRLLAVVRGMLGAVAAFQTGLDDERTVEELHRMALAALLVE